MSDSVSASRDVLIIVLGLVFLLWFVFRVTTMTNHLPEIEKG